MSVILWNTSTDDYYPKDSFCVHRSGEGSEEARALPGVEIDQDRFDPAGDAEFAIDVVEVGLHGVERHTQLIRDVFIATPGRGTSQNLPLTLGQQCSAGGGPAPSLLQCGDHVPSKAVRHEGGMNSFPPVGGSDDAKKLDMVGILQNVAAGAGLHRRHDSRI